MKPEQKSQNLLSVTRAKAKMFEYDLPLEHHIKITEDPAKLFSISIGLLGDFAYALNNNEAEEEKLLRLKEHLIFSARFFDSFYQAKLEEVISPYLMLIGAASYYLCDLPGSASVLIKGIKSESLELDTDGLEHLLLWLLQSQYTSYKKINSELFDEIINDIAKNMQCFFKDGKNEKELIESVSKLRKKSYENGSARQLLFGDIISAIIKQKLRNSTWKVLPLYSGIEQEKWQPILQKDSFIKEFWSAQHRLGSADVLKGKSAIIQMPTSAGKTKSTELIIRSAFLAERTSFAVVIAPFRALCNEIKNSFISAFNGEVIQIDELSDVLQVDFEISKLLGHKQIIVATPEKLLYILRHNPELAVHIGLLIFDEGHQFDSGARGITYELLITSLNVMIPKTTQKVLISAVISNAEDIGRWLDEESNVINGITLTPTFRTIGFTSWLDQLGGIEYIDTKNIEQRDFFVPRVIEKIELAKKGKEKKDIFFPEKNDGKSIALYLSLKLVSKGSVAIFCGRKDTAVNICEKAIDIIERGIPFTLPSKISTSLEVERLRNLHIANLGDSSPTSLITKYGIFSHHGNVPHGIRLAVEHAMREGLIRFIICTSTLAQGVNLPIRYLLVTSIYQGKERIKVRDFHNLIGRAGRSGMHTEGSILFVDPEVYDKRGNWGDKWRWEQVKELLNPNKSERCLSNILSIFEPIKSDDGKYILPINPLDFTRVYISSPNEISEFSKIISEQNEDKKFSYNGVESQISWRINLLCSLESFLLASWDVADNKLSVDDVVNLAEATLAFFLADSDQKEQIRELFRLLAENIESTIKDPVRRKIYGKTLYGIQEAKFINKWLKDNENDLVGAKNNEDEFFNLLWEIMERFIRNASFNKFNKKDILMNLTKKWILGESFDQLYQIAKNQDCRLGDSSRARKVKIETIIDICEGGISYDGSLLIGALVEFLEFLDEDISKALFDQFQFFQKRFKYGLPSKTSILLYEIGFSDRVISQELEQSLDLTATQKQSLIDELKQNKTKAEEIMKKYPSYFQNVMSKILV